jgi:hypothetical protein
MQVEQDAGTAAGGGFTDRIGDAQVLSSTGPLAEPAAIGNTISALAFGEIEIRPAPVPVPR